MGNYFSLVNLWKCLSSLCLSVFVIGSVVTAYNLDLTSPIIRRGTNNTYFGYSVALHNESSENMMIVGAPRGESNVRSIVEGGAVYRCPITPYNSTGECHKIALDKASSQASVNRSHQWMGATVKSSGQTGKVLSCSPRLKRIYSDGYYLEPLGGCTVSSKNFTAIFRHSPCRPISERQIGHLKETHCQAGFSADMLQDGQFVLGGPGRTRAKGSIYFRSRGRWRHSAETFDLETDAYLGYSVAQGTQGLDVVAGSPRAGRLKGKVYVFKYIQDDVERHQEITGQQFGSYFGHSVAIMDLNNDGLDDLIVGAPNYQNKGTQQINVGQVYVYYQTEQGILDEERKSIITGQVTDGRFGFTVAPLGDVNDDGFNDLAVSAPYERDGAVYIFNGRRETIHTSASQVLRPSDFQPSISMLRFGFALSGNRDADSNSYPDLLIGAYESDTVILVRTRPIIRPEISISFADDRVHLSRTNNNDSSDGFGFKMCLSYSVRGTTDHHLFRILLGLDTDKLNPRALFEGQNQSSVYDFVQSDKSKLGFTVNLTTLETHCTNWTAVMRDSKQIQDKLSPIPVRVSVSLIEDEGVLETGKVVPYLETPRQFWEEQITINYKCVNNGTCAPDLILHVESDTDYMYMGDSDQVSLNVTVANIADEAFGAKLYVNIPDSFGLSSFKSIHAESLITCELLPPRETIVSCNIGNPIHSMKKTKFTLTFDVHDVPGHTETLYVNLTTNSTLMEEADSMMDNNHTVSIRLIPKVEVEMGGFSNMKRLVYNEIQTDETEQEDGNEIVHNYWVKNKGPAVIKDATLIVSWPMKTDTNENLLYVTDLKITEGGKCVIDSDNLKVDPFELSYYPTDGYVISQPEDFNVSDIEGSETSERSRRNTDLEDTLTDTLYSQTQRPLIHEISYEANCSRGYAGCVNIICNITNFSKKSGNVVLTITSRLQTKTVQNPESRPWTVVSSASFTINRLPYVSQPDDLPSKYEMLSLWITPKTKTLIHSIPLWAIILSVALGNSLMIVIILCLWKIGFFKRKRMRDHLDDDGIDKNGKGMEIIHVSHDSQVNTDE